MAAASGYSITETIYKDEEISLNRGVRNCDGLAVIIKSTVSARPSIGVIEQLEHEFSLRESIETTWALRPIELLRNPDQTLLVFEGFAGDPLDIVYVFPMETEQFLDVSTSIASVIAEMNRANIIHKDINPRNILIDPVTGEIKLTGFGFATVSSESQPPTYSSVIEGSLSYISPEQTGRMNRPVDYRTDIYSLGITFYQMLTGTTPFADKEPLEMIYSHIAVSPEPPSERLSNVPQVVSDIVMKLMSKVPDDRYQSALGLRYDLELCRSELASTGRIEPFTIGTKDISERLQVPQKLYGRDKDTAFLIDEFEKMADEGTPALMLISGYSGIGKSSLVRELYRPTINRNGFFASGKFDQYKRNIPYSTIVQAFQELIQQILTQSEAEIGDWRQKLLDSLGMNGQLIVDVIPQLELIIGEQPPVVELPPTESQSRFNYVFRQFLGVFTAPEHPLVVFLDDLQWADDASLKLMEFVFTYPNTRYLLIVGAYRDNEVSETHPLVSVINTIENEGSNIGRIHLSEIAFDALGQLLADVLYTTEIRVYPLTQMIFEKTRGNPFFVIQLLRILNQQGLVWFDGDKLAWEWDIEKINAVGFTDNVADLMVLRLKELDASIRNVLKLAAAVGNRVDVHSVAVVSKKAEPEVEKELQSAADDKLMIAAEGAYRFAHDRIQQAAYSFIPEADREGVHLNIGRLLLADNPAAAFDERIFDIVNQFNQGAKLIKTQEELEMVAELNLTAGRRAKASAAYSSAVTYLREGISLLPDDAWESLYKLTYTLHIECAECEFMSGNFDESEKLFPILLGYSRTNIDKSNVFYIQAYLHTTKGENDRAVESGIECLKLFGIYLTPHPPREQMLEDLDRVWKNLGNRSIESLAELPPMENPEIQAAMTTLVHMLPAAYFTDENLRYLVSSQMVNLTLQYGNSVAAAFGYVFFGINLGTVFKRYKDGYRFGQLALKMADEQGSAVYKGRIYYNYGNQTSVWNFPMRDSIEYLDIAYDILVDAGDVLYACYSGNNVITLHLFKGDSLSEIYNESTKYLDFAKKVKYEDTYDIIRGIRQLIRMLQGLTYNFSTMSDDQFDEDAFVAHLIQHRMPITLCWHYILMLQARFFAGDYDRALEAAEKVIPLLWTSRTVIHTAQFYYFYALVLSALYERASDDKKAEYLDATKTCQAQYKEWADNCTENFLNGYLLISAEIAGLTGNESEAMRLYDHAIRSAKDNGFIQNEAVSNEVASRFYLRRGFETIGKAYIREARYCYQRWRADGKVKQLDQQYPQFLDHSIQALREAQLDVMTVVRASQAISSEIDLAKLLDTLMKVVVEQAGAENGYLLLEHNCAFSIDVEAKVESGGIKVAMLVPPKNISMLPESIVNYVTRTREMVLLDDATSPNPFSEDRYIAENRPKSVLCLPIVRQAELVGMLYLENKLLSGAFTQDRISVLELLASQSAISIQNALEYTRRREAEEALRELTQNLEQRVAERTAQLEAANKELEAFSYSVSHDLRAPLRSIDGFSQAILEDYGEKLGPDGRDYLRRVRSSTQRTAQLIDDLLRLSRVTRTEMKHELVNLSSMTEEIVSNLRKNQPEQNIEVNIQPDVTAYGDGDLLKIVLENLLSNAWKFVGKKPVGRIEFGMLQEDHECIYYIKDNGEGFDMTYADRLFTPFQRLHSTEEFPGTGIGLAIVQRIVNRHGGRVWGEGKPGEGATFYFALP